MEPRADRHLCIVADDVPLARRDDDALMQLAAIGVRGAFEVLVGRHQGALRSYCARRCGGAGDEVAQEVFVTIWQLRRSYDPRGRFRAFLFTIAERRCRNQRRDARRAQTVDGDAAPGVEAEQLDGLLARERQRLLYERVALLSAEQREAILLHFAGGLDYAEIAEVARRPEATIRSRVFLGLKRLRTILRKQGGGR